VTIILRQNLSRDEGKREGETARAIELVTGRMARTMRG